MFAIRPLSSQASRAFSTLTFKPGTLANKQEWLLKILQQGNVAHLKAARSQKINRQLSSEPVDTTKKLEDLFNCLGRVAHLHAHRIDLKQPGMRETLAKQMVNTTAETTFHLKI